MTPKVIFELIIELIIALSHWLWPAVTLVVLLVYRKPISALLGRVKKGELFGQGFELEPVVDDFQRSVKQVEEETARFPQDPDFAPNNPKQIDTDINQILDDSKGSPELAIIRLSNLLENEIKVIVASLGSIPSNSRFSVYSAIQELRKRGSLPDSTFNSLEQFRNLRNQIVHGKRRIDDKETLRVLDIGIDLLRAIRSIPHEVHTVQEIVDVYDDPKCTNKRQGVKGIIVNSKKPDGGFMRRLFHTTKVDYYESSKQIAWEWDRNVSIPESWYIDHSDGSIKKISGSLDFIGRQIGDI